MFITKKSKNYNVCLFNEDSSLHGGVPKSFYNLKDH